MGNNSSNVYINGIDYITEIKGINKEDKQQRNIYLVAESHSNVRSCDVVSKIPNINYVDLYKQFFNVDKKAYIDFFIEGTPLAYVNEIKNSEESEYSEESEDSKASTTDNDWTPQEILEYNNYLDPNTKLKSLMGCNKIYQTYSEDNYDYSKLKNEELKKDGDDNIELEYEHLTKLNEEFSKCYNPNRICEYKKIRIHWIDPREIIEYSPKSYSDKYGYYLEHVLTYFEGFRLYNIYGNKYNRFMLLILNKPSLFWKNSVQKEIVCDMVINAIKLVKSSLHDDNKIPDSLCFDKLINTVIKDHPIYKKKMQFIGNEKYNTHGYSQSVHNKLLNFYRNKWGDYLEYEKADNYNVNLYIDNIKNILRCSNSINNRAGDDSKLINSIDVSTLFDLLNITDNDIKTMKDEYIQERTTTKSKYIFLIGVYYFTIISRYMFMDFYTMMRVFKNYHMKNDGKLYIGPKYAKNIIIHSGYDHSYIYRDFLMTEMSMVDTPMLWGEHVGFNCINIKNNIKDGILNMFNENIDVKNIKLTQDIDGGDSKSIFSKISSILTINNITTLFIISITILFIIMLITNCNNNKLLNSLLNLLIFPYNYNKNKNIKTIK